jgi:hypothetical protein
MTSRFQSAEDWLATAGQNTWLATVHGPDGSDLYQNSYTGVSTPYAIAERAALEYFTSDIVLNAQMLAETLRVVVIHSSGSAFGPIGVETSLETIADQEI